MSTIEEQFPIYTAEDSVRLKDWAAGSKDVSDSHEIIFREGKAFYERIRYPPQLLKIVDEPLVNAIDHIVRCIGSAHQVTYIRVEFDSKGRITITNDGPGFVVAWHEKAKMYVPEHLLANLYQGTNVIKSGDCIIGGTNGIGAKLSIIFSTEYTIDTVDSGRKLRYVQTFRDGKRKREDPVITPYTGASYTKISFIPDYVGQYGYKSYEDIRATFESIIYSRTMFAASYASYAVMAFNSNSAPYAKPGIKYVAQKTVNVYYNGTLLSVKHIADIAKAVYPSSKIHTFDIVPDQPKTAYKYPWQCAVVITDEPISCSNVNGIVVKRGKHIDWILNKIDGAVRTSLGDKLKGMSVSSTLVGSNVAVFLNAQIPNPNWTGQTKEEIKIDSKLITRYLIDEKTAAVLVKQLKDVFMASTRVTRKKKPIYDKYKAAKKSTSSKQSERLKCSLLLPEGDSAATNIGEIITDPTSGLGGYEYYGSLTLGGVTMNITRKVKEYIVAGKTRLKLDAKVFANAFYSAFFECTGLNPEHRYDPASPTYAAEMANLSYGRIIICVDQDLDGNNICGLILSAFHTLWPCLLEAGYVLKFSLPLIRAYPHGDAFVEEFYNEHDFSAWAATVDLSKWRIKYYKGIAGHDKIEIKNAGKNFNARLQKFTVADAAATDRLFEIYYDDDPEKRKVELAKPYAAPPPTVLKAQQTTRCIDCTDFLSYDVNSYQKDNIKRHLLSAVDGMNQAGRKIYHGLLMRYRARGSQEEKVAQMAGFIAESQNYHHGEMSLADSITRKGFVAIGGVQVPQIVPCGQFGTRLKGGDDAGSARYIFAKFNHQIMNILYPFEDYYLLPFTIDEGERYEPDYFMPILPTAILEHYTSPGSGWASFVWGRDVLTVAHHIKRMITMGVQFVPSLPLATCGWKGTLRSFGGKLYSFGSYTYDPKTRIIHITELPFRQWTDPYKEWLEIENAKSKFASGEISSRWSNSEIVDISFKLVDGLYEKLMESSNGLIDGVMRYFRLYDTHADNLAMVCADGKIETFADYVSVLKYWFPLRKEMYAKRIDRNIAILEAKIKKQSNIVRYIAEFETIFAGRKLSTMSDSELDSALVVCKYDKIDSGLLKSPKFATIEQIKAIVGSGSYSYLLDEITEREKSIARYTKHKDKLAKLIAELEEYKKLAGGPFPGANMWCKEIDDFITQYKAGVASGWLYGDKNKRKYR